MKTPLGFAAALATASLVHAGTGYLRPEIAYVSSTSKGADAGIGAFVAGGIALGATGAHELELEVGWAGWERSMASVDDGGLNSVGHSDNSAVPLLLNYRFRGTVSETVRAYVEVGLGGAQVSADWDVDRAVGNDVRGSEDATGAAAAIGAGFAWQFGERTSLTAGVRYLMVRATGSDLFNDFEVSEAEFDALTAELGLRIEF